MFKKIAILLGLSAGATLSYGQGAKFGLHLAPLVSFMGSNDPQIKADGASGGFDVGLELEYYFMESEKVALTFGVDFSLGKGGRMLYKYGGQFFPKAANDGKFDLTAFTDVTGLTNPGQSMVDTMGLDIAGFSRIKHSVNYIEIPLALKLRPAEFGDWKIFVHVPEIRAMIPVMSTARVFAPDTEHEDYINDVLGYRVESDNEKGTKASVYKDMFPFQVAVGLGAGAEWAPTDKLRVYAGIYYSASLLDITKKIETRDAAETLLSQSALEFFANGYRDRNPRMAPHTLGLRIGVLFVP